MLVLVLVVHIAIESVLFTNGSRTDTRRSSSSRHRCPTRGSRRRNQRRQQLGSVNVLFREASRHPRRRRCRPRHHPLLGYHSNRRGKGCGC
ncbi:hypothetical protein BC828DRAFT_390303 [Blastocladiella britannica]|nr:hypothetical protein BC828DRAFT_390303 [Blastocladiella britannica]